jgi:uncharacterized membrane protein
VRVGWEGGGPATARASASAWALSQRASIATRIGDEIPFALGVASGIASFVGFGFLDRAIASVHWSDFSGFWAGAHALASGVNPYDRNLWPPFLAALDVQASADNVFGYPAWVALALVPFGFLPLELATAVWDVLGVVLATFAARALVRRYLPRMPLAHSLAGFVLFGSPPAIVALYSGQWTFLLLAAGCALALEFDARHGRRAALLAVGLLAKPHLAAFALWSYAVRARALSTPAFMPTLIGGLTAVPVASLLVIPNWWTAWLAAIPTARVPAAPDSAVLAGALYQFLGPGGTVAGAVLVVAGVVLSLRVERSSDAWLPIWLALSLAATPYSWIYDQLLLLVPIVLGAGALRRDSARAALAVMAGGVVLIGPLNLLLYQLAVAIGRSTPNGVIPALVFAMLYFALRCDRRRHARG